MSAPIPVPCEQLVYLGARTGWSECGHGGRLVTLGRSPPMWLCPEHEQEATAARAAICLREATVKR